jgi:hypothetical protein
VDSVHAVFYSKINSENPRNSNFSPENSQKCHPTSKIHIFSTTTPKIVILAPKFSESLPLSIYAFILYVFVAFL